MSVSYDVTTHPLLSEKAKQLDALVLIAQNELAESVLGVRGSAYGGIDPTLAKNAVVLQLNLQVASGIDAVLATRVASGKSGQSTDYRGLPLHPTALLILQGYLEETAIAEGGGWPIIQSLRGPTP